MRQIHFLAYTHVRICLHEHILTLPFVYSYSALTKIYILEMFSSLTFVVTLLENYTLAFLLGAFQIVKAVDVKTR